MAKIIRNGIIYSNTEDTSWTGKSADVAAAIINGEIKEGTVVNITDDEALDNVVWTGTLAEWKALDHSKFAEGTVVHITDDYESNVCGSVAECEASSNMNDIAGATAVKELNNSLNSIFSSISKLEYHKTITSSTSTTYYSIFTVPSTFDNYYMIFSANIDDTNPIAGQDHTSYITFTQDGKEYNYQIGEAYADTAAHGINFGGSYISKVDKDTDIKLGLYSSSSDRSIWVIASILFIPVI